MLERIARFRRRRPRLTDDVVTLAHGAGGKASAALIDAVFLERLANPALAALGDSGEIGVAADLGLGAPGDRLVMTTDSFVVSPWRFPGGSIGTLAVHGTVNDLVVSGARPLALTAAFVIEEGFLVDDLRAIVDDMAAAAAASGVAVVAGDTKVVNRGAADGIYITTAGTGVVAARHQLGPERVQPGDIVVVSGPIGDHGTAVMLARGDLALEAEVRSDTADLGPVVNALLEAAPTTRWLRDATRGGVATVCNELAAGAGLGVVLDEQAIPVRPAVAGACELLGIDPLYVANEGTLIAVVGPDDVDQAVAAMRATAAAAQATPIGEVVAEPADVVVLRTAFGSTRIVDMLVGDPLPRIC